MKKIFQSLSACIFVCLFGANLQAQTPHDGCPEFLDINISEPVLVDPVEDVYHWSYTLSGYTGSANDIEWSYSLTGSIDDAVVISTGEISGDYEFGISDVYLICRHVDCGMYNIQRLFSDQCKCGLFANYNVLINGNTVQISRHNVDGLNCVDDILTEGAWKVVDENGQLVYSGENYYAIEFEGESGVWYTVSFAYDFSDCGDEIFNVFIPIDCPTSIELDYTGVLCPGNDINFSSTYINRPMGFTDNLIEWYINGGDPVQTGAQMAWTPGFSGTFTITVRDELCNLNDEVNLLILPCNSSTPICDTIIEMSEFEAAEDPVGPDEIPIYFLIAGQDFPFPCLKAPMMADGVVEANAISYKSASNIDPLYYETLNRMVYGSDVPAILEEANDFERGEKGRWIPGDAYVYRKETDQDNTRNYNHGTFTLDVFNWDDPSMNDLTKWFKPVEINHYAPNGSPVESENLLGIKSCVAYGYNNTVPVVIGNNAGYGSVSFESFENLSPGTGAKYFDNGAMYETSSGALINELPEFVHTGGKSLMLSNGFAELAVLSAGIGHWSNGLLMRVWIKVAGNNLEDPAPNELPVRFKNSTPEIGGEQFAQLNRVSGSGEWMLYELEMSGDQMMSLIDDLDLVESSVFSVSLKNEGYANTIYIDDVKIQPLDSEVEAYVYNQWLKPVAVFGDQHFALIFQYDIQGRLVRKQIETERGVKTIEETIYNVRTDE